MSLPRAQAVVGHLLSDAVATCVGGDVGLPNYSAFGSAGARDYGQCLSKMEVVSDEKQTEPAAN